MNIHMQDCSIPILSVSGDSASGKGDFRVWEITPRSGFSTLFTREGLKRFLSGAWAPNGTLVACGSEDGSVGVWAPSAEDGSPRLRYWGHGAPVTSVAWSPDGARIASSAKLGDDQVTCHVWEASTGNLLLAYEQHTDLIASLAWSPDGSLLASASWDGTLQVWDPQTGEQVFDTPPQEDVKKRRLNATAWSPDGARLLSAGAGVTVYSWDPTHRSGSLLSRYERHSKSVFASCWSPEGARIASGSYDDSVQVWDAGTGDHISTYTGHSAWVRAVAFSPSGGLVISGDRQGEIHVWEVTSAVAAFLYREHRGVIYALAWCPVASHHARDKGAEVPLSPTAMATVTMETEEEANPTVVTGAPTEVVVQPAEPERGVPVAATTGSAAFTGTGVPGQEALPLNRPISSSTPGKASTLPSPTSTYTPPSYTPPPPVHLASPRIVSSSAISPGNPVPVAQIAPLPQGGWQQPLPAPGQAGAVLVPPGVQSPSSPTPYAPHPVTVFPPPNVPYGIQSRSRYPPGMFLLIGLLVVAATPICVLTLAYLLAFLAMLASVIFHL